MPLVKSSNRFIQLIIKLKSLFTGITLERLLVPVLLFFVIIMIISYKLTYKIYVEFPALNGVYQTFNPIRRIFDGQIPSVDFVNYLGIGTTYLISILGFLTGKTFAAVTFSNHFLHTFCHFLALSILLYLLGLSSRRSLVFASFIVAIALFSVRGKTWLASSLPIPSTITSPLLLEWSEKITLFTAQWSTWVSGLSVPLITNPPLPLTTAWIELMDPSLSNLGLRSILPFLTTVVILIGYHCLKKRPFWLVIGSGAILGVQPLWSNDYGFISALSLSVVSLIVLLKQPYIGRVKAISILILASILSLLFASSIVTRGNPYSWMQEVLGVGRDQFWYFGSASAKVFSLDQVFPDLFLYYNAIALVILFIYICASPIKFRETLLLYIGLTTLGAGMISSIGSMASTRYYIPALLVFYFILIFFTVFILKWFLSLISPQLNSLNRAFIRFKSSSLSRVWRTGIYFLLLVIYAAGITIFSRILVPVPDVPSFFYVKQLGGWLPDSYLRAVQVAEHIKTKTERLAPESRILSTYASMIDTLVGSKNATGIDYIIHALGEPLRQRYRDRYHAAQPQYITTLRADYSGWENWVQRVNWWFYREFLRDYQPVDATFYNIIWQRRNTSMPLPPVGIQCTIDQQQPNEVNLTFTSDRPSTSTSNDAYFIDVTLNYSLQVKSSGIPLIGNRGIVNVTETKVAIPKLISSEESVSYGLPPQHENWHIPVLHRFGEPATITLTGFPSERTQLQVNSCQARAFIPASWPTLTQLTTAKNLSNVVWQNGIANLQEKWIAPPSKAAFLVPDSMVQGVMIPGMMVEFAKGGLRKVIEIRHHEVWVSGESLDPKLDGYPNPIRLHIQ